MNLENVKALADLLNAKGLSAIEVGEGENRIRIEREVSVMSAASMPASAMSAAAMSAASTSAASQPGAVLSDAAQSGAQTHAAVGQGVSYASGALQVDTESGAQSVDFNNLIEVKSPLVGVYYAAPSPDAETFVSIGSKVKKGDVLCIIETMKLMNEIMAEQDGEIVDICVKNGDIAEFGQVLFKMF